MHLSLHDDWEPPRKPAVLRAGIALAALNIFLVLIYASFATKDVQAQYFTLAAQMIQALLLYRIVIGVPGMRWVYIAYDLLQLAVVVHLQGDPGGREIVFAAFGLAAWTCLLLPASHAWFARAARVRRARSRAHPGILRGLLPEDAVNGVLMAGICAVFFYFRAFGAFGFSWPLWAYLGPLFACMVLEVRWGIRLASARPAP